MTRVKPIGTIYYLALEGAVLTAVDSVSQVTHPDDRVSENGCAAILNRPAVSVR